MRLIDADALIAGTKKNRCADCDRRKGIKRGKTTFVYEFGEAPCRACDVGDMIDTLDEAPTIGGWISVKDRMPETNDEVLVTYIVNGNQKRRYVECASWFDDDEEGHWSSVWDEYRAYGTRTEVIAWMPMPKPYKPPKEDKNGTD